MRNLCMLFLSCLISSHGFAQWQDNEDVEKPDLGKDLSYKVEMQASFSDNKTPLWLNANVHGLSSLEKTNGYLRGALIRPLQSDSMCRWGVGYGVDVAVPVNYTSKLVVQQAFVEGRWLHGVLTVGAKEYPMELKNNRLSTGAQALGINARPVPQVRLALPDYWTLPILGRWFHLKGHLAYGKMTDSRWQKDFTHQQSKYTDGTLYHSKAGYLKIGSEDRFVPLSAELGLETATLFGGTSYSPDGIGNVVATKNSSNLKSFIRALVPGGSDAPEKGTNYQNVEGDVLGSWLMRINYEDESWRLGFYGEKYFEDHSSMLQLDYDGYGQGEEWNIKKHRHYFLYDFKDVLLGAEFNIKYGRWIRNVVAEYVYTKYQSGPIYHDHSVSRSDHVSGKDNYYNHYIFSGWQHWGQPIGSPLYRAPLYNENGNIRFDNNRFVAWHLGVDGEPTDALVYRVLATYQTGWGTYDNPFVDKQHNFSFMVEAAYSFPKDWKVRGAYGMDFGKLLGSNAGFQLTISKSGIFNL